MNLPAGGQTQRLKGQIEWCGIESKIRRGTRKDKKLIRKSRFESHCGGGPLFEALYKLVGGASAGRHAGPSGGGGAGPGAGGCREHAEEVPLVLRLEGLLLGGGRAVGRRG